MDILTLFCGRSVVLSQAAHVHPGGGLRREPSKTSARLCLSMQFWQLKRESHMDGTVFLARCRLLYLYIYIYVYNLTWLRRVLERKNATFKSTVTTLAKAAQFQKRIYFGSLNILIRERNESTAQPY